jgi:hypothetical protein
MTAKQKAPPPGYAVFKRIGKLRYLDQQQGRYFLSYVIKDVLGRPRQSDPYFDHVDMVGPKDETIVAGALTGRYDIDQLIKLARPFYPRKKRHNPRQPQEGV